MKTIIVVGSSNIDTTMHVDRFPEPGETITASAITEAGGGKGANQAISCAKSGAKTYFINRVGEDSYGEQMKRQLASYGVDTTFIQTTAEQNTGHAYITLDKSGQNDIIIDHGANSQLSSQDVAAAGEMVNSCDCIIAQFETPLEATLTAFKLAKKQGAVTILNPAPAANKITAELAENTDIIAPNESESAAITGIEITDDASLKQSAVKLQEMGFANVVITLGAKGSYIKSQSQELRIPAFKTNTVDTTGAGDTFIGYLAGGLKKDLSNFKEAAMFASRASAIAVTRLGAQPSIPTRKEVVDAMEQD